MKISKDFINFVNLSDISLGWALVNGYHPEDSIDDLLSQKLAKISVTYSKQKVFIQNGA